MVRSNGVTRTGSRIISYQDQAGPALRKGQMVDSYLSSNSKEGEREVKINFKATSELCSAPILWKLVGGTWWMSLSDKYEIFANIFENTCTYLNLMKAGGWVCKKTWWMSFFRQTDRVWLMQCSSRRGGIAQIEVGNMQKIDRDTYRGRRHTTQ